MQKLGLIEKKDEIREEIFEKQSFWKRQFQKKPTHSQKLFDWFFGVIMPVICFAFDPAIFKGGIVGTAYLGKYKPFAYILSFVSVMAMSAFLIWGRKLKWMNALLAGFFAVGGFISLIIGIVMLPISLLGLIILIGVLGFTPFFSSLVFLRNSLRAFQFAMLHLERKILIRSTILAAIFSLITPAVINFEIQDLLNEMKNGDVQTIRKNSQYLKFAAPITNFDSLTEDYDPGINSDEIKTLAEEFENLTGETIEDRVMSIHD